MIVHEIGHLLGLNHPFAIVGKGRITYDPNVVASDVISHNTKRIAPSSIDVMKMLGSVNKNTTVSVKGVVAKAEN